MKTFANKKALEELDHFIKEEKETILDQLAASYFDHLEKELDEVIAEKEGITKSLREPDISITYAFARRKVLAEKEAGLRKKLIALGLVIRSLALN